MAFPVTVSTTEGSAEQPGKYGSYKNGANRYEILALVTRDIDGNVTAVQLVTSKSSDGGLTWAHVDAAGGPTLQAQFPAPYCCCQSTIDTAKLFACFWDFVSGSIGIAEFNCGTDSWGVVLDTTLPPYGAAYPVQSANGFYVCAHHTATDSVVFAMPGDFYTDGTNNEFHVLTAFAAFDVGGAAWGSWVTASYTDYASVISWKQFPVGLVQDSDGNLVLFMQQETSLVSLDPSSTTYSADGTFDAPWYVDSVDVETTGAGGGGASTGPGGGGGGGGYNSGTLPVTPNSSYAITVGVGGSGATTPGGDGGDSDFAGSLTANGGQGGGNGTQQTPGTGGGPTVGGDGGTGTTSGGGGGAGGSAAGAGGNGTDGGVTFGGAGGTSPGSGGIGGTGGNAAVPPVNGTVGTAPGGGGGGSGTGVGSTGGDGAAGSVVVGYTPVQGTVYQSRLWQQRIYPDLVTLGTLTEISEGQFPPRPYIEPDLPMPFDCAGGTGEVAIAFTGANGTSNANISVGRGSNADPVVFSFQTFDAGNSGSEQNSSPALAYDGATLVCEYCSIPAPPAAQFRYRVDAGGGFGGPSSFGSFAGAVTRPQAMSFSSSREVTFGTPTVSSTSFEPPA